MLWMMLEGSLEINGEGRETRIVFDDIMNEWQIFKCYSRQAIRIPFSKVFKPHL